MSEGSISRRDFLKRAAILAGGAAATLTGISAVNSLNQSVEDYNNPNTTPSSHPTPDYRATNDNILFHQPLQQ